jgi:hypothetical protein
MQATNSIAEAIYLLSEEMVSRSGTTALTIVEESDLSLSQIKALLLLAKTEKPLSMGGARIGPGPVAANC